jgi:hypothetical protein
MSVSFGKVAHAPGAKPEGITASYTGKHGVRNYQFDRPEKHVFELIYVTKQASAFNPPREGSGGLPPEKCYELDDEYSASEGIPPALEAKIRQYADERCADDVTSDNIEIRVSIRR